MRLRRFRALLWCLALSLLFHFGIVPLIVGLFGRSPVISEPLEQVYQARSSSLRISQRAQPQPQPKRTTPQPPKVLPKPAAQPARSAVAVHPPNERREIARVEPRARIRVPHVSSQPGFAQQQEQFERTIARLREQSDPLANVQRPVQAAPAPKHYAFDFRASIGDTPHAEGYLHPVKFWRDGPYDYYYVEYQVQYSDGGTETGYVPWPIRFPSTNDPFGEHLLHVPLPVPLPDYVLPPGTNLRPLVAFCYAHRDEFTTCPIAHG